MYKYGKWSYDDSVYHITIHGVPLDFEDLSAETQVQLRNELLQGNTSGDFIEVNEPLNEGEIEELRLRSAEIMSSMDHDLYEPEYKLILISERDQINRILED